MNLIHWNQGAMIAAFLSEIHRPEADGTVRERYCGRPQPHTGATNDTSLNIWTPFREVSLNHMSASGHKQSFKASLAQCRIGAILPRTRVEWAGPYFYQQ
jgi:hypothetical protein